MEILSFYVRRNTAIVELTSIKDAIRAKDIVRTAFSDKVRIDSRIPKVASKHSRGLLPTFHTATTLKVPVENSMRKIEEVSSNEEYSCTTTKYIAAFLRSERSFLALIYITHTHTCDVGVHHTTE
jgi:hypothetical protein